MGHGLLVAANSNPDPDSASMGGSYVMMHVGPAGWGEAGSTEDLLLFAVISTYARDADEPWAGCATYLERAFAHMRSIGEQEAARRILAEIDRQAGQERPAILKELLTHSLGNDPGKLAEHDQEMAKALRREYRAAHALM